MNYRKYTYGNYHLMISIFFQLPLHSYSISVTQHRNGDKCRLYCLMTCVVSSNVCAILCQCWPICRAVAFSYNCITILCQYWENVVMSANFYPICQHCTNIQPILLASRDSTTLLGTALRRVDKFVHRMTEISEFLRIIVYNHRTLPTTLQNLVQVMMRNQNVETLNHDGRMWLRETKWMK